MYEITALGRMPINVFTTVAVNTSPTGADVYVFPVAASDHNQNK